MADAQGSEFRSSVSTPTLEVDVLVIGWGKGGKTFAAAMASQGKTVAMVEQSSDMYGGTCINIGCVPTKALVHEASVRRRGDDPHTYFTEAVETRDQLIAKLNAVNFAMLNDRDLVTVVDGRARFVAEREVEVEPRGGGSGRAEHLRIVAETVVINTGAVPVMPDLPGADGPRVHDSTSLQHVRPFPKRLAIVGAGPIGLEFASMFQQFGSQVTLLVRGERILPREDADVAGAVASVLTESGIEIRTNTEPTSFEDGDSEVVVRLDGGSALAADAVLLATGRRPATDDLNLAAAGVDIDARGAVVVDDQLRTTAAGVYAMGDVRGGLQQTFISLDDYRVVLDAVSGSGERRVSDRVGVPSTVFITPPFSSVGMTEGEATEQGHRVKTAFAQVVDVKAMPRPKTLRDARGIIKFVVDAETDKVFGARLFHVDSQEVINLVALAMRAGVTASELRDGIWTHPSSTEALNEVLGQLRE
ncbi:FAD-dependent oxidoreductase [Leucobacter denitrificans]|uniref:FAD-dependent oxidoreductase n=1 Tax=Leucobacter denitrificans TaxID=683042 RepID=A0A7G9S6B1_9MICO|nr:FAD-dependent oxidoreductase [Leucobacter denitrificans]QNN63386.1 FAD-dependent oxidoreductase [Leucobacter denitrificans]